MSRPAAVAWKALDPDPVRAVLAEEQARVGAFLAAAKEIEDELDCEFNVAERRFMRSRQATGLIRADREAGPLVRGFRRDGNDGFMRPDKRTTAGKAWAARLDAIRYEPPELPGVPSLVMISNRLMSPGVLDCAEGVFVTLSMEPTESEPFPIDTTLWEPVRLSEYYAAREAHEGK